MEILGIGNAIVDVICKVEEKFLIENSLTKSTMKTHQQLKKELLMKVLTLKLMVTQLLTQQVILLFHTVKQKKQNKLFLTQLRYKKKSFQLFKLPTIQVV